MNRIQRVGLNYGILLLALLSLACRPGITCTPEPKPSDTPVPVPSDTPVLQTETPYIPPGTATALADTPTPTTVEETPAYPPPPEEWQPPKELAKTGNPLAAYVALGGLCAFTFISARIVRKSRQT